jgi:hypothetical protein
LSFIISLTDILVVELSFEKDVKQNILPAKVDIFPIEKEVVLERCSSQIEAAGSITLQSHLDQPMLLSDSPLEHINSDTYGAFMDGRYPIRHLNEADMLDFGSDVSKALDDLYADQIEGMDVFTPIMEETIEEASGPFLLGWFFFSRFRSLSHASPFSHIYVIVASAQLLNLNSS